VHFCRGNHRSFSKQVLTLSLKIDGCKPLRRGAPRSVLGDPPILPRRRLATKAGMLATSRGGRIKAWCLHVCAEAPLSLSLSFSPRHRTTFDPKERDGIITLLCLIKWRPHTAAGVALGAVVDRHHGNRPMGPVRNGGAAPRGRARGRAYPRCLGLLIFSSNCYPICRRNDAIIMCI
jgi:hypothetical protein